MADVVEEEVVATIVSVGIQVVDRKDRGHSFHTTTTTTKSVVRYALKKVMQLMSVGIASMRIMYQMRNLLALCTTPMMSTQTGTLILVHLITSQAT
jgi:hypothetical protein